MKAISLSQPHATLIAAGYTRIETRSWDPHGLREGPLVAIHAAKHWTDPATDQWKNRQSRNWGEWGGPMSVRAL